MFGIIWKRGSLKLIVRIAKLQQEIYALKQDSRTVTKFYSDLKLLWEELEIYLHIPNSSCRILCTCDAMHSAHHNDFLLYVIRFLTCLNGHFVMVKSYILLMGPLPPLNKVFSMVLRHIEEISILMVNPKYFLMLQNHKFWRVP
jgi:hypothetical protein